jgi:hypothetical protein
MVITLVLHLILVCVNVGDRGKYEDTEHPQRI